MNDDRDIRLSCLQMAVEIHCQFGTTGSNSKDVLRMAEEFRAWVDGKEATVLTVVSMKRDEQN